MNKTARAKVKLLFAATTIVALMFGEPAWGQANRLQSIADRWRDFVEDKAASDEFSGAVLLASGDKVVWQQAFGKASKRFDVDNNVETKFNLGSMNKMFTGIAICQLYEQGKLEFDDTISEHLPDYENREVAGKVTIEHLLTHTSGLGSYWNNKYDQRYSSLRTLQDYVPLFMDDALAFEPGSQSQYSNVGPMVLGLIIEKVSGQSYYDYVKENIFHPADMENTDSYELDVPVPNLAIGYSKMDYRGQPTGGEWRNNYFSHAVKGGPAGGGYSTVGDLHRFALALKNDTLLKRETRDLMLKGRIDLAPSVKYGYLFGVHVEGGCRRHGHTGGASGISAEFFFYPDLDISYAVLSNYDRAATSVSNFLNQLVIDEFGAALTQQAADKPKYKIGAAFRLGGQQIHVAEVFNGSAADEAGLQVDDVIVKVNDTLVAGDFLTTLDAAISTGKSVGFVIRRGGKLLNISVVPKLD